jgi:hypothetical protein
VEKVLSDQLMSDLNIQRVAMYMRNDKNDLNSIPKEVTENEILNYLKYSFEYSTDNTPRLTGYGVHLIVEAMKKCGFNDNEKYLDGTVLVSYRYLIGEYDDNYINMLLINNQDWKILIENINLTLTEDLKRNDFDDYKTYISSEFDKNK